jgi:hypothetical protein
MPIPVHEIAVGRCYATVTGQVRRVSKIEDDTVEYQEFLPTEAGGSSGAIVNQGLDHFAQRVNREVPCDGRNRGAGWT